MIDAMTLRSIRSADSEMINEMIKEINARRSVIQKELRGNFTVGQTVEFNTKKGNVERGEIEKINRKTIYVRTAPLVRWKVAPSFLRAV